MNTRSPHEKPAIGVDYRFENISHGDVQIRVAVAGSGPLLLFVHGWPESWFAWRHQLKFFANHGFRAAAIDVRGYGGSSNPSEVEAYGLRALASDVAAVIAELSDENSAVVIGQDWGAPITYTTALFHSEQVRAVVGLSVPYVPVSEVSVLEIWRALYDDQNKFFYQSYFREPGIAEAELSANSLDSLTKIYTAASAAGGSAFASQKPLGAKFLDGMEAPETLPSWLKQTDLEYVASQFEHSGWTGPLNRYRAQGLDSQEIGRIKGKTITQPCLFLGGENDPVRRFVPGLDLYERAGDHCAHLVGSKVFEDTGHWVQQEAAQQVNKAILSFVENELE